MTAAERLAAEARQAARIRALSTDPDVIALRVERIRVQVDRLMWAGIVLGLGFTMTNVQAFAAAGAPAWSLAWCSAWALDPMVSLVLLAVLRAEQVTARWQVRTGPWVRRARWLTLAATYMMNTWTSWTAGSPSGVVLHSVPPLVVFVAAEAVTGLREALTDAIHRAAAPDADDPSPASPLRPAGPAPGHTTAPTSDPATDPATAAPAADLEDSAAEDGATEVGATEVGAAGEAGPEDRAGADPRVLELVELLAAGAAVTGLQAAALHGVSPRQARRLLADARDLAQHATPGTASDTAPDIEVGIEATDPPGLAALDAQVRPHLHVIGRS